MLDCQQIFISNNLVSFFSTISFGLVKPLTVSVLITFTRQQARHEDNKCVCLCNTGRHSWNIFGWSYTDGGLWLAGSSIWPNKDGNCSTFITLTNYNLRHLFVTSLCIIWIFGQPQNIYTRFKYSLQPILIISNIHAWTVMLKKSLDHEKGDVNRQCMSGLCNTNQYKHAQSFISHLKGYALQTFWSYNSSNLHNQQLTGGKKNRQLNESQLIKKSSSIQMYSFMFVKDPVVFVRSHGGEKEHLLNT